MFQTLHYYPTWQKRKKNCYLDVCSDLKRDRPFLLLGISSLIIFNQKQFVFKGTDSSFDFYIFNNKKAVLITDLKKNKIAETNKPDFIQTVWEEINKFVVRYEDMLDKKHGVTIDLYNSIAEFKTQFADILINKTKR